MRRCCVVKGASDPGGSGTSRVERAILLAVLLIVGGALGYAAYRASNGRSAPQVAAGDVVVVSKGEVVDLSAHLVKGKYTIYDFYADWCPPCRVLDVQLRELAARHDNVAIRKIDIVDWTTPVVAQHKIEDLPHMVIYDPDGKLMAAGDDVFPVIARLFDTGL
jgi:thiol-disulfide isomerase/thioredoxin